MTKAPAGAPPFKSHRRAYRELMEKLWYAADLFRNEGDGGLDGARTACLAVKDFIAVRHENPELAAPFLAIAQAFEDLEQGVAPDLFSTSVTPRQRSRSSEHRRLQILAASLLDVLIYLDKIADSPRGRDRLASMVAGHVRDWPGMERAKAITIINWRDQIQKRPASEQQQFEAIKHHILSHPDPQSEVANLLKDPPGASKT
jgi:hypothetical protein